MGSSTGTRNFGMRRFTNLVREGRYRAPAAADLRLGTFVEVDPSDPDRVREATDTAVGGGTDVSKAVCGILWYEHDAQTYNDPRFGGASGGLPQDLWWAPRNRMVQVLRGRGTKVWFRNTLAATPEAGLNFPNTRDEVIMVDGIGIATPTVIAGTLLGWNDSDDFYEATTTDAEAIMVVHKVYDDGATVDAELLI